MLPEFRIAYLSHSISSDWNNGNAHFLRGLLRELGCLGHQVTAFEPDSEWSINNLLEEPCGPRSLSDFFRIYQDLHIQRYVVSTLDDPAYWRAQLREFDVVILHEWNPPNLAHTLLAVREQLRFKLLFHDTHHRASSSPAQIDLFGIQHFDGVLAFGEALRTIYRRRYGIDHAWTLHEAADTTVFHPERTAKTLDCVWIGNWGEGERTAEIDRYLLKPASQMQAGRSRVYGVRYPPEGLEALRRSGIDYGGYLPNLDAPAMYAQAKVTLHIPRQQYTNAMIGIPTIRVFEALACGIPLVSAPWQDTEALFCAGDFGWASDPAEMLAAIEYLLHNEQFAAAQAERGLQRILARHTCRHRAEQLTSILEECAR